MALTMYVNESMLNNWALSQNEAAKGTVVELVYRLIIATIREHPKSARFPHVDSIGQHGPDGELEVDTPVPPYIPGGRSYWQIGTGRRPASKATADYEHLTASTPAAERAVTAFIFVTPLSALHTWEYTWKEGSQNAWLSNRRKRLEWADVRIVDGTKLIHWLESYPAVERWLALQMGEAIPGVSTLAERWNELSRIGAPPTLSPELFLANREQAKESLLAVLRETTLQLKLETRFAHHAAAFCAACVQTLDDSERLRVSARTLVVSSAEELHRLTALREPHTFIADFEMDGCDDTATMLLHRANTSRHAIVYYGNPGGPHVANSASLPPPKRDQVEAALIRAGYASPRARQLATKAEGNLSALLRLIQNISTVPAWLQNTPVADFAIAELLGRWEETNVQDRLVAEGLLGNAYGEWTKSLAKAMSLSGTPLSCIEGHWRMTGRYEAWYALAPHVSDEQLSTLLTAASTVLVESNPKYDLPAEQRLTARVDGHSLKASSDLRRGLAETLAIIGNNTTALTRLVGAHVQLQIQRTIQDILAGLSWKLMASLGALLPLLAEAAPNIFLECIDNALQDEVHPLDQLLAEADNVLFSECHYAGLLWALEALAWHPAYFAQACDILAELSDRDPGGSWGNRPINSLAAILSVWMPQTLAGKDQKFAFIEQMSQVHPDTAWRLLQQIFPRPGAIGEYTYSPIWLDTEEVEAPTRPHDADVFEAACLYNSLRFRMAHEEPRRLAELLHDFFHLPAVAREELLGQIEALSAAEVPDDLLQALWMSLTDTLQQLKHHAALRSINVAADSARLERAIIAVAPKSIEVRAVPLFGDSYHRLLGDMSDYEVGMAELEARRIQAVSEIFDVSGLEGVIRFAHAVEWPWQVGRALAQHRSLNDEHEILPSMLLSEEVSLARLAGGYVTARFESDGTTWLAAIGVSAWLCTQIGQLLAYLPFGKPTWVLAGDLLGEAEAEYWIRALVVPYIAADELSIAIPKLIDHRRIAEALKCIEYCIHRKYDVLPAEVFRALTALSARPDLVNHVEGHTITDAIQYLQQCPYLALEDIAAIEYMYIDLIGRTRPVSMRAAGILLANDPAIYCDIIDTLFKPRHGQHDTRQHTDAERRRAHALYRVLTEWSAVPGAQYDGSFNAAKFDSWLTAVTQHCRLSDRFEVAMSQLGEVLIFSPPDGDGLWLHRTIAAALDRPEFAKLRDGYRIGLYNRRGMHGADGGAGEKALAAQYETLADEASMAGYHRLAGSLRTLAEGYERESEHEALVSQYDDIY